MASNNIDWWNAYVITTRKPFVWESYTVPIRPERYTPSPNDHEYNFGPGNSKPVFIIFLFFMAVGVVGILVVFCYRCSKRSNNQSTSIYSNNQSTSNYSNNQSTSFYSHTPLPSAPSLGSFEQPRYVVDFAPHPVYRPFIPNQSMPEYRATSDQPEPTQRVTTIDGPIHRSNASEKPPGYAEVVMADLNASHAKFPEVKPLVPESPPPKYGEENLLKY